jgi:hypothetical protein
VLTLQVRGRLPAQETDVTTQAQADLVEVVRTF